MVDASGVEVCAPLASDVIREKVTLVNEQHIHFIGVDLLGVGLQILAPIE